MAEKVAVAVRVRPLVAQERDSGCAECTSVTEGQLRLGSRAFTFDAVFAPGSSQAAVYDTSCKPLVEGFLKGYHATILAYGQTGAGKTFTMGTAFTATPEAGDSEMAGVVPRALAAVFAHCAERAGAGAGAAVRVSLVEVYKEELRDLLAPSEGGLSLREDASGCVSVAGLSEHPVAGEAAALELLRRGSLCRATGSTSMNARSSRSHAICTLALEQQDPESGAKLESKLHLVDLAGSERAKRTKASGERLREGININRGLLALGNVISALTSAAPAHVPYRDSKLTRLLQDSLGGNSKTVMLAHVSPADTNFDETLNTLRYASRAKHIQNAAVVNAVATDAVEVASLRREIKSLQLQLLQASCVSGAGPAADVDQTLLARVADLEATVQMQNAKLEAADEALRSATDEAFTLLASRDRLRLRLEELGGSADESGGGASPVLEDQLNVIAQLRERVVELELERELEPAPAIGDEQTQADLDDVEAQLAAKEQLVQSLGGQQAMELLQSKYQEAMEALEAEVSALQADRSALAEKLAAQPAGAAANPAAERRVAELERQIKALQARQAEFRRLKALKAKGDDALAALTRDVEGLKRLRVTLQQRLRDESQRHRAASKEQRLEACQLRRQGQRSEFALHRLQSSHERQAAVLRRKHEEVAALTRRVRDLQTEQRRGKAAAAVEARASARDRSTRATINRFLARELEVAATLQRAQAALGEQMAERAALAAAGGDVAELSESIARLQQLSARLAEPAKARWAGVRTLADGKRHLRALFDMCASLQVDVAAVTGQLQAAEEEVAGLSEQLQRAEVTAVESQASVLGLLTTGTDSSDDLTEQLEELRGEIRRLSASRRLSSAGVSAASAASAEEPAEEPEEEEEEQDSGFVYLSDDGEYDSEAEIESEDDSDYVESPAKKAAAAARAPAPAPAPAPAAAAPPAPAPTKASPPGAEAAAAAPGGCQCGGKCATKKCPCRGGQQGCSAACGCKDAKCINGKAEAVAALEAAPPAPPAPAAPALAPAPAPAPAPAAVAPPAAPPAKKKRPALASLGNANKRPASAGQLKKPGQPTKPGQPGQPKDGQPKDAKPRPPLAMRMTASSLAKRNALLAKQQQSRQVKRSAPGPLQNAAKRPAMPR